MRYVGVFCLIVILSGLVSCEQSNVSASNNHGKADMNIRKMGNSWIRQVCLNGVVYYYNYLGNSHTLTLAIDPFGQIMVCNEDEWANNTN